MEQVQSKDKKQLATKRRRIKLQVKQQMSMPVEADIAVEEVKDGK